MSKVEAEGKPHGETPLLLLDIPYYPFPITDKRFNELRYNSKKVQNATGILHTGEFPKMNLFFNLIPQTSTSQDQERTLKFYIHAGPRALADAGFLHKVRTNSSLGQTKKLEYHDEFFPEYRDQFTRLGIRIAFPAGQNAPDELYDGVLNKDELAKGKFTIDTFFDRLRDSLEPQPLTIPFDQQAIRGLCITFSYEKTSLDPIYTETIYEFES